MKDNTSFGLHGKKQDISKLRGGIITIGNNLGKRDHGMVANPELRSQKDGSTNAGSISFKKFDLEQVTNRSGLFPCPFNADSKECNEDSM